MIVHPVGDSAEIVMQVDHSLLAGELAEHWSGLEPRDPVLVAAALHDCGWRVWEAAPRLDPRSARPENFLDVEIDLHLKLYATAIAEVTARDRYAGMLVAKHLTGIYRQRYGTQAALTITRAPAAQTNVDAFVGEIEQLFGALQRELGVSDEEFWRNYVLLQVFDRLSLWLCRGDPAGWLSGSGRRARLACQRRDGNRRYAVFLEYCCDFRTAGVEHGVQLVAQRLVTIAHAHGDAETIADAVGLRCEGHHCNRHASGMLGKIADA